MTTKTKHIIATGNRHIKEVALRHPLNGCPAVATQQGYYTRGGRVIGLVLLFPDGHTASLTFDEISELQAAPVEATAGADSANGG